jgi:ribonuclease VapC
MPGRIHRNPHVSILCHEPGYEKLEKRLAAENGPFFVSSLVKFEASHALARQKSKDRRPTPELLKEASNAVEAFVEDIAADEIAISPEVGRLAIDASTRYGKAVGHVADLNFGDCFAYACAKALGVSLLYKGHDFAKTDLA